MSAVLSASLALIVLGISGGAWRLWGPNGFILCPAGSYAVACGLLLALGGAIVSLRRTSALPSLSQFCNPWVWSSTLIAVFVSDWLSHSYAFLQGPLIRGELFVLSAVAFSLLGFLRNSRSWLLLPLAASGLLMTSFFSTAQGRLLISDDHAMFVYRLMQLREHFPFIPYWSPAWNAGVDARDFFATGALNAFILGAPLLYPFGVEATYNIIIALLLFALVPASTYSAALLMKFDRRGAGISALLAMCTSLLWYKWALKYGTVGFVISSSLLPLTLALALRFIHADKLRVRDILFFTATTTLTLLWPLAGITLVPLVFLALPQLVKILKSPSHLIALALLLSVNLPWMAMFWKVSKVSRFITSEQASTSSDPTTIQSVTTTPVTPTSDITDEPSPAPAIFRHRAGSLDPRQSLTHWQEGSLSLNPIILALAVPAVLSLSGVVRSSYIALVGWLMALGTFGVSLKPQLELDRMLVVAAIVLCLPIGRYIVTIVETAGSSHAKRLAAALVGGFVLTSPFAAATIIHNRSLERYHFKTAAASDLQNKIKDLSAGGRTLFAGCMLHELSGGHLGPLPLWTNTPLIASSYVHNIWRYQQPIPESYLERGDSGIKEYLTTMNVTLILAKEPKWRDYFSSRPNEFAEVTRSEGFTFYKPQSVNRIPSYVLEGSVHSLSQTTSSVTFVPQTPNLVLKFSYFPFLTSSRCDLSGRSIAKDIVFIELRDCPLGEPVTIQSNSPVKRLFS